MQETLFLTAINKKWLEKLWIKVRKTTDKNLINKNYFLDCVR